MLDTYALHDAKPEQDADMHHTHIELISACHRQPPPKHNTTAPRSYHLAKVLMNIKVSRQETSSNTLRCTYVLRDAQTRDGANVRRTHMPMYTRKDNMHTNSQIISHAQYANK